MYNRYSLKKGIGFVIFVLLLQIPFMFGYGLVYAMDFSPFINALLNNGEFMTFVLHMFIFVLPSLLFIFTDIPKGKICETLRINNFTFKNFLFVIVLTILIMPLISLISYSTSFFVESVSDTMLEESLQLPFIISFLSIGVMPAITEELVFRGILLSTCDDKRDRLYALINGFLFGAMHGNFSQFFYAMVLGIAFYYFVKVSNSIFMAVIPHFLINGSQVMLVYWLSSIPTPQDTVATEVVESTAFDPVFFGIMSVIVAVCMLLYWFIFRKFVKYNNYTITGYRYKPEKHIDLTNVDCNNQYSEL